MAWVQVQVLEQSQHLLRCFIFIFFVLFPLNIQRLGHHFQAFKTYLLTNFLAVLRTFGMQKNKFFFLLFQVKQKIFGSENHLFAFHR